MDSERIITISLCTGKKDLKNNNNENQKIEKI